MILHGNSLEILKTLDANSVDAVVCDPPYFLTNSGGSGFMGKEWDSLSVRNAFAESVLRSLSPVWLMGEESSALANVSTKTKSINLEKNIRALYVTRDFIAQNHKLSQTSFSVLENVLTKLEVLALSRELCPDLTSVVESQPENVLYVANNSFIAKCPKSIAQELALKLDTKRLCEDLETLHLLMGDQKTSAPTEEMTGRLFEAKPTEETSSLVESVENIVLAERYSVTTSSLIESQKIIRWITSLRFVRSAMGTFMENPANIQLLSERFHYKWLKEVYRVMKPGAHLLAFAGTRTYGRLAVAVEDAGFEIRDQIQWIYGSGFPKSHDISKAIDKAAGAERSSSYVSDQSNEIFGKGKGNKIAGIDRTPGANLSDPAITDQAKQWQGFGTALKPANEPIVLARKPLEKGLTVAENVLKWGCGALNIDGSRIEYTSESDKASAVPGSLNFTDKNSTQMYSKNTLSKLKDSWTQPQGRWPANVIFDEEAAALLDEQSGISVSRPHKNNTTGKSGEFNASEGEAFSLHNDSGGASRFFYCAKASKSERNAGLDEFNKSKIEHDSCEESTELAQLTLKAISELIPNSSIVSCGENTMAIFPKECSSITKTTIQAITELKTWNSLMLLPTSDCMKDVFLKAMGGTNPVSSVQNSNGLMTVIGILHAKAGLVTDAVKHATLKKLLPLNEQSAWQPHSSSHPTVKPTKLMSYLCKLITPPNGTILDPFMGSGSTGVACKKEGFNFIGIELNEEYVEIALKRVGV